MTRAMVMAAGRGERMRPHTMDTPKPLLQVGGRALLDRTLDWLEAAGVERTVVNAHYEAAKLEAHVRQRQRPPVAVSFEPVLLGSGGGVRNALPWLGEAPFFVLNGDLVWRPHGDHLRSLLGAFDPARMDFLLSVFPQAKVHGDSSRDYFLEAEGRLRRDLEKSTADWFFAGLYVTSARSLAGTPTGVFSMRDLWDKSESEGRLFGHIFEGEIWHVGTPDALAQANRMLNAAA